jgi:hypothetical protein
MNLNITLNQKYKSFEQGFNVQLSGNLIILSGINGTGKSQLIDIISQREGYGSRKPIQAIVEIDGKSISRYDISRRSFKENVNVPELTQSSTDIVRNHRDQVWSAYSNYTLDFNNENLWDYKESCQRAKDILIKEYGEDKFKSKLITQINLQETLPSDFIWKSDDIFTNFVGELFFNYTIEIYHAQAEAGKNATKFDISSFPTPPWSQLNDLFLKLGFEYRFKQNYFVGKGFQINEQPFLYQLKKDGQIDESERRKLADLSEGEKARNNH